MCNKHLPVLQVAQEDSSFSQFTDEKTEAQIKLLA